MRPARPAARSVRPRRPAARSRLLACLGSLVALACAPALAGCGPVAGSSASAPAAGPAEAAASAARPSASASASGPVPATGSMAKQSPSSHSTSSRSALPSARSSAHGQGPALHADHVVGHGTPASCTSQAVVQAVAAGGVIAFSCGPHPVTIVMTATAKVRNTSARVVLDGGGLVTLSGGGARRILYLDTCDPAQTWITSHCQDQATPALTVRNITFADGNSTGQAYEGGGGGAIFDRGGQLTVVNTRFTGNRCDSSGPDLGGAAIRALSQYQNRPVQVTGSTFTGGVCSNGGALSSIGVSWVIKDSTFTGNRAIGNGANPAQAGTPGGGSGGAIYTDGDDYTVTVDGSVLTGNSAREGGGALFFVSNDKTGTLTIGQSRLHGNPNAGFQTAGYPGIFFLGRGHPGLPGSSIS